MSQRVLALTDLAPDQPDWKGAVAWRLLLSLAEAHHEITVATPLDPSSIPFAHPRLQILQPVRSWRADQMPKLAKLLALHRPQGVHLFGLRRSRTWPLLSVWPYLGALLQAARIPFYVTLFESDHPESSLSKYARQVTVLGEDLPLNLGETIHREGSDRLLIPAGVDEWLHPEENLTALAQRLRARPALQTRWLGGWGSWSPSRRRAGWEILEGVQDRVSLTEAVTFEELLTEIRQSSDVFIDVLATNSWRHRLVRSLSGESLAESSANFLSRMYSR